MKCLGVGVFRLCTRCINAIKKRGVLQTRLGGTENPSERSELAASTREYAIVLEAFSQLKAKSDAAFTLMNRAFFFGFRE